MATRPNEGQITCKDCDSIILELPNITDTNKLIIALRSKYKLEVDEAHGIQETISKCQLVDIGKAKNEFILIEYDYKDGCMAAYPWKYQIIFKQGNTTPIHIGAYDSIQSIELNNEKYLLATESTGKGNGLHKLLTVSNNSIINVLDLDYDDIHTVDSYGDDGYFVNPLSISVKDFNHDGYEDLVFKGSRKMLMGSTEYGDHYDLKESEYYIKPVVFVFIYDSKSNKYIAQEDYWKKYIKLYL
ncbi:hypothetical protein [Brumimicrobium mesophilum]|uniref:hypothetical protein n=1 Tax=Brumimicrobium mesophilum TaxID=392717 RepID=UPI00131B6511|nr:hypothetical protein [Brumimicrobium mesophilum]